MVLELGNNLLELLLTQRIEAAVVVVDIQKDIVVEGNPLERLDETSLVFGEENLGEKVVEGLVELLREGKAILELLVLELHAELYERKI